MIYPVDVHDWKVVEGGLIMKAEAEPARIERRAAVRRILLDLVGIDFHREDAKIRS